jgi:hypothetical protein
LIPKNVNADERTELFKSVSSKKKNSAHKFYLKKKILFQMNSDVINFKQNYLWMFIVEETNYNVTLRYFAQSKMRLDSDVILAIYKNEAVEGLL